MLCRNVYYITWMFDLTPRKVDESRWEKVETVNTENYVFHTHTHGSRLLSISGAALAPSFGRWSPSWQPNRSWNKAPPGCDPPVSSQMPCSSHSTVQVRLILYVMHARTPPLSVTVLQRYNITVLQCYSVTTLQHHITTSQCHSVTVLQRYNIAVSQCHSVTALQHHSVTVLQEWFPATSMPYAGHRFTGQQTEAVSVHHSTSGQEVSTWHSPHVSPTLSACYSRSVPWHDKGLSAARAMTQNSLTIPTQWHEVFALQH